MTHRVGFGPRAVALLSDIVVITGLQLVLYLAFHIPLTPPEGAPPDWEPLKDIPFHVHAFADALVVAYLLIEGLTGASPGKRLLGLAIGTAEGTRGTSGFYLGRAAIKWAATFLVDADYLLSPLGGAGVVLSALGNVALAVLVLGCFLALGSKRQALHDLIAKSAVYKAKDLR